MFAGCAQEGGKDASSSAEQVSAEKKTVELTDQNGRTVTVEYPVERIACMQHHSLDILTQLGAQEQIVCTEDKWMTDPYRRYSERSERRGDRGAGSRSRHFSGSVQ